MSQKVEEQSLIPIPVEVCLSMSSTWSVKYTQNVISSYLEQEMAFFETGFVDTSGNADISNEVDHIYVELPSYITESESQLPYFRVKPLLHIYQCNDEGGANEMADTDEDIVACKQWTLPAVEFDGLWNQLYFDDTIKDNLLNYASTALLFSQRSVNPDIIGCNRVVLLHGPPGTGKTTLCKALAQKLCIRYSDVYEHGQLLEINAHSLFSKWFSESGKLVMKLFERIQEMVEDEISMVFVLIDEVESLTAARQSALGGSEPSDAIRVVNALLTQIDSLRQYPNVMILTTSNITEALDTAFIDRADIKQYIGPPGLYARYEILRSCIGELQRVNIIEQGENDRIYPYKESDTNEVSQLAVRVAEDLEGLSGRILRKLPFQVFSSHVHARQLSLHSYLEEFLRVAAKEREARDKMNVPST